MDGSTARGVFVNFRKKKGGVGRGGVGSTKELCVFSFIFFSSRKGFRFAIRDHLNGDMEQERAKK